MKIKIGILAWVFFVSLVGCSRNGDSNTTEGMRARIALKETLLDARLVIYDDPRSFQDVASLQDHLRKKGSLTPLELYARSNIFLNPDFKLWASNSETEEFAIVISPSGHEYLGVRFDGSIIKTQDCPVPWANKR